MSWLLVALGGALGAVSRFGVGSAIARNFGAAFPYGTLCVNIVGSFVIGVLWVWLNQQHPHSAILKHLLIVGFLGGFTTFSSFSLESIVLMQEERWLTAFSYVSFSVLTCLAATACGIWIAKSLISFFW